MIHCGRLFFFVILKQYPFILLFYNLLIYHFYLFFDEEKVSRQHPTWKEEHEHSAKQIVIQKDVEV